MHNKEAGVFTDRIEDPALTEDTEGETWTGQSAGWVFVVGGMGVLGVIVYALYVLGLFV